MTEARRTLLKARQAALLGRINMAACANNYSEAVFTARTPRTMAFTPRTCRTCLGASVLPAEVGGELEFGAETTPCHTCQGA